MGITIQIMDSGHVTRDDAAFPTLVKLHDGTLLCAYTAKGDGPNAMGGTDISKSVDGGCTWEWMGTICGRAENPVKVNSLRLSQSPTGRLFAYGERTMLKGAGLERDFSNDVREPIFCTSDDEGKTWSHPHIIPIKLADGLEISNPIVFPKDGQRLLAPCALLPDERHLGERVVLFESRDGGETWPNYITMLKDPFGKKGFFEQKVIHLGKGTLLAAAWTVTLGDYSDLENHFSWSHDFGKTWSDPKPTGIEGQTMTPLFCGYDEAGNARLICLSNRRYGKQGVVMYPVTAAENSWQVKSETMLWDANASRSKTTEETKGIDAFDDFAFGLPSAIALDASTALAVHWCKEGGVFGVRWTKFSYNWQ